MALQTQTLSLLRKTKDHNSSPSSTGIFLQLLGSHSPVLFNPAHTGSFLINFYNKCFLFFRRAFFSCKYALGITGFTVILRATGRICAIFNEIFALTFATGVSFNLDNHNWVVLNM